MLPVVFGVVLIGSVDGVIVESVVDVVLELEFGDVVERLRELRRDERVVVVVDGVLMVELVDIVLSVVVGDCTILVGTKIVIAIIANRTTAIATSCQGSSPPIRHP